MDKKPGLLLAVSVLAIIILAASFNMDLGGNAPIHLPKGVNPDDVLYVCPAYGDNAWAQFSEVLHNIGKYVYLMVSFMVIVLMFSWGWALYQNLLKDKFVDDAYKNPWGLTKLVFWLAIIVSILFVTPNRFRTVHVRGSSADWVLCENTSDGAKATWAKNVSISEK